MFRKIVLIRNLTRRRATNASCLLLSFITASATHQSRCSSCYSLEELSLPCLHLIWLILARVTKGLGWWWSCSFYHLFWSLGLTFATTLRYCWKLPMKGWNHSFEGFYYLPIHPHLVSHGQEEVVGVMIAFQKAEKVKVALSITRQALAHFLSQFLTALKVLLWQAL